MNKRMVCLPDTSRACIRGGAWFVFDVREHRVHAWLSVLSGRARVFVDGECVHESRDFRRRGNLAFGIDKTLARLDFQAVRSRRIEVALRLSGAVIQRQAIVFHVPLWARLTTLAADFACVVWLTSALLRDAVPPWFGVLAIGVAVLGLAVVERIVFGQLRLVTATPDDRSA